MMQDMERLGLHHGVMTYITQTRLTNNNYPHKLGHA